MKDEDWIRKFRKHLVETKHDYYGGDGLDVYYAQLDLLDEILEDTKR